MSEAETSTMKVEVPEELEKATEVHEAAAAPEETAAPIDGGDVDTRSVDDLMSDGSEKLAKSDYAAAAELFAFAVEKLVEKHGELAIETVDALEAYGNALLKNAIAQSGVLGNNADANKAEQDGDNDTRPTASIIRGETAREPLTAANINFHFGGDGDDDEEEEEGGETDEPANQTGGEVDSEDDLETAWGILDTARTILTKEDSDDRRLQLARVHCSMAEVATESARPEDGVKEYEAALAIQSAVLPKWDRLTAQTHLFIALALELIPNNQFDAADEETKIAEESYSQAIDHIKSAKAILTARADHLQQNAPTGAEAKLSAKNQDELKDIEELQGELDNKIDDLKAQAAEAKDKQKSLEEQIYQKAPSLPEGVSREVHDLNTLVKKKPKKTATQKIAADTSIVTNGSNGIHEGETNSTITHDTVNVTATFSKRKVEDDEQATADKRTKVASSG